MQGLEASSQWFANAGLAMLQRDFAPVMDRIAAGLVGRGSECFGFDDQISQDHDFELRFALFLTAEDDRKFGFQLERAYRQLRKDTLPAQSSSAASKLGDMEHGVIIIGDFYQRHLGFPGEPTDFRQWLYTPEYAFAEATNGAVFYDGLGEFTRIRQTLLHNMPEDVRKKKLAARAAVMAQSGQYNYMRCIKHGEAGAAALALDDFVCNAVSMIFLLNGRFAPYYKWMFRAMRNLPKLGDLADGLEKLLNCRHEPANTVQLVEDIASAIIRELKNQNLTSSSDNYLEAHAFEIMQRITSQEIRSLHIMEG